MSKEAVVGDQRLRNKLKSIFELTQQNPIPWKKINKQMQLLLDEFKTSDLAKSAWAILLAQQGQTSEALQVIDDVVQRLGILKGEDSSSSGGSSTDIQDITALHSGAQSDPSIAFEDTSTQILHDIATNQSSSSVSITLTNVLTCYKLLKRPDKIQTFYQSAWNKCIAINNKSLARQFGLGLFSSLLRSRDWAAARTHAMNLYRTYNDTRYFMWHLVTVCLSVPLDVPLHSLSQRDITTLQVAEGLFAKTLLTPGKVATQQEILWYIRLLQRLQRYQHARDVLQSDSVVKLFPIASQRDTLYAELLSGDAIASLLSSTQSSSSASTTPLSTLSLIATLPKSASTGNLPPERVTTIQNAIAAYTKLLRTVDADEWLYYRALFTLTRTLNTSEAWSSLRALLSELSDIHQSLRGPPLAQLEYVIHQIEIDTTNIEAHLQSLSDRVIEYVKRFGDRTCCFRDIRPAACVLHRHQRLLPVVKRLDDVLASESLTSVSSVHRRTCCEQLRYAAYFTPNNQQDDVRLNAEDVCRLMTRCWGFYHDAMTHIKQSLASSERYCGDDLLLLTALMIPRIDSSLTGYLKAMTLLEFGLQRSPYNFQFTLTLVEFYRRLGAAQMTYSLLRGVDVKQIQCDTLGHLLLPHLVDFAAYREAELFIQQLLVFHNDNKKTTPDLLFSAFQYGAYCKIPEILRFETRLSKSTTLAWAQTLQLAMHFALHAHTLTDTLVALSAFEGLDTLPTETTLSEMWCNDDVTVADTWDLNLNNVSCEVYFSQHLQRVMTNTENSDGSQTSALAVFVPQLRLLLLRITHLRVLRALASLHTTATTTMFASELKTLGELLISLQLSPLPDSPDFYSAPLLSSLSFVSLSSLLWRIVYFALHLSLSSRALSDVLKSSTSPSELLVHFEKSEKDLATLISLFNSLKDLIQCGPRLHSKISESSSSALPLEFPAWLYTVHFLLSVALPTTLLCLQAIAVTFPVRLKRISDEIKRKHAEIKMNLKAVLSGCEQSIKSVQIVLESLRANSINAAILGLQVEVTDFVWLRGPSGPQISKETEQILQNFAQKTIDHIVASYRESITQLHDLCKGQLITLQSTALK
jgi:hypothetical protein